MRRLINWLGSGSGAKRTTTTVSRAPKLGLEGLDDRTMLSVTMAGSMLNVIGTEAADTISVREQGGGVLRVDLNGVSTYLAKSPISLIHIEGRGGNDVIRLDEGTDVTIMAQVLGGNGDDTIRGGAAGDMLNGDAGNDTIFGNGGNDIITGGSGNDNLYGGSGADVMNGGSGNDGLFGGIGSQDVMEGGSGSDRFLMVKDTVIPFTNLMYSSDTIVDLDGTDARVNFESGTTFTETANYGSIQLGVELVPGASWSNSDVERVDEALKFLHQRVGNNTFLKTSLGNELTFQRYGTADNLSTPTAGDGGLLGINWNTGLTSQIGLTQQAFNDRMTLLSTVFHEVGHNWDDESPIFGAFKSMSGWTQDSKTAKLNGLSSGSSGWFFNSNAGFARDYATTNPHEDFAETFALVMMQDAGTGVASGYNTPESLGGKVGVSLQMKLDLVRAWMNGL